MDQKPVGASLDPLLVAGMTSIHADGGACDHAGEGGPLTAQMVAVCTAAGEVANTITGEMVAPVAAVVGEAPEEAEEAVEVGDLAVEAALLDHPLSLSQKLLRRISIRKWTSIARRLEKRI
mmetsp:Transcript_27975/g.67987  ORF Transcript_27975/g.67987 Transcript_27975/m.67987 type:complete len:121 (-) Transcript_27975:497-859(-)